MKGPFTVSIDYGGPFQIEAKPVELKAKAAASRPVAAVRAASSATASAPITK